MRAMYYEAFEKSPEIRVVADPTPSENGVVVKVDGSVMASYADGSTQYHSFLGETGTDTPPLLDLTVDNALPDARWQGAALFNVNVPTNTALQFEWGTESRSFCFQTQACRAEADGLHSFNLSLSASTGTVLSGSGYDFLGQPAPPVPEPSTWALLLGGLGIAGAAARRRRA